MNCSCRTAALRIFVKSVFRVHTPPSFARAARTHGARSFQSSSQPIRFAGHRFAGQDGLRRLAFPVASARCTSSTVVSADEHSPEHETASDTPSAAPDNNGELNDAAPPQFQKALKAKKKQKKLEAKRAEVSTEPSEDAEHNDITPEPQEDKIPKNRRKREARQAGTYVPGQQLTENISEASKKPSNGKRGKRPPRERKRSVGQVLGDAAERRTAKPEEKAGGEQRRKERHLDANGERLRDVRKRLQVAAEGRVYTSQKSVESKRPASETRHQSDATDPPPQKEHWQLQKAALKEKFPEGWAPRKRLSPDALAGIRALHQQFPEEYTTEVLANKFEVSAEAVRRILKSKWEPQPEEEIERQERWFNRGKRIWSAWADEGMKPPAKWRKEGVTRDPSYHEQRRARSLAQRKLAKTLV